MLLCGQEFKKLWFDTHSHKFIFIILTQRSKKLSQFDEVILVTQKILSCTICVWLAINDYVFKKNDVFNSILTAIVDGPFSPTLDNILQQIINNLWGGSYLVVGEYAESKHRIRLLYPFSWVVELDLALF